VRSVSGPHDVGIEKSFLGRLSETLFGRTEEYLIRPTGVAERDGVLYVADPGAQALWIFDPPNQRFVKVSRVGRTALASPVAVALGPEGTVFVVDSWLKKVFLLDRKGKFLRTVVEDGLERPAGLAYDDAAGQVYVADSAGHRIAVYSPDGARVLTWGRRGSGDGEFNHPTHLVLDRSGTLLVTDALNFRIQAFDRTGRFLWKMGRHGDSSGDFAAPKGVAADSEGHLYVVDALFDAVQLFERKGIFLLAFGERGMRPGQFWLPGGIFINGQDRMYVADSYNQRVQVFDFLPAAE
jgi:DNA-binding beta-propeller fold protein YncE